jgi:hypothetical protein
VSIDELEVYITPDGLGRAAIVRRDDGLLCIYVHWKWSESTLKQLEVAGDSRLSWRDDRTPISMLYEDREPEPSLYGTLDDARRELRGMPRFAEATRLVRN